MVRRAPEVIIATGKVASCVGGASDWISSRGGTRSDCSNGTEMENVQKQ